MIKRYSAYSLAELIEIISNMAEDPASADDPLWFRGHNLFHYKLLPTALRSFSSGMINELDSYNSLNLTEDSKLQVFKSRSWHLLQEKPRTKMEWMALYRHYGGSTRLLDWSESLWTALSFALDAFLSDSGNSRSRDAATPAIWVLRPIRLNQVVFDFIKNDDHKETYIKHAIKPLESIPGAKSNLTNVLSTIISNDIYNLWPTNVSGVGIPNLSVIDERRIQMEGNLAGYLAAGEFNPFFYLCLRYYNDAYPIVVNQLNDVLPPLSIYHHYQSDRMRNQKGAFTIFPNYHLKGDMASAKELSYDCRCMENQNAINSTLFEIRLLNPTRIAKDFIRLGASREEIYPESEIVVRHMESDYFK